MNEENKTPEDIKYEYELVMENGKRLEDLAMALCHFDYELAKQALAIALGTLTAFSSELCLHDTFEFAKKQMEAVSNQIKEEEKLN